MDKKLTPREARFYAYWTAPDGTPGSIYEHWTLLDMLREGVSEHEAEHVNETALFGDSGPGMGYRLNKMKFYLGKVERRLKKIRAKMEPPAMPAPVSVAAPDDDDIPF